MFDRPGEPVQGYQLSGSEWEQIVADARKKKLDLEKAMGELDALVEQLEAGELTLDKSLQQFEKGVRLSRECQAALTEAEQKVKILMNSELQDVDPETLE
jgi:exodeoxyribonuclease VII small subunit